MIMRRASLVVGFVLAMCGLAWTQDRTDLPRFTLAEEVIIARNDALDALVKVEPWSVRKIMDAMAAAKQAPPRDRQRDVGERRDGAVQIDTGRNPDLDVFQRASP